MATEFQTVLDHGTYVLNARVVSTTKTVQLFLVGEREGEMTRIVENNGEPFFEFELKNMTDSVDVFKSEYLDWLEAGGQQELENALNPISVFNLEAVAKEEEVAPEPTPEPAPAPKAKAAPKKRAAAKPKPKAK